MDKQSRAYRESMLLSMSGPLSMSEPQLLNAKSSDLSHADHPLNGHTLMDVPKMDERRNSDGDLPSYPRLSIQDKKKIGHRRVDEAGNITYKKVPANELMQSIQEGIRHSVSKLASEPERDVLFTDFENTEIVFHPREGTKFTPAHNLSDFHFKTYAPIAFRHFRETFEITPEDYMMSLCTEPLIEISNPGASGSLFYLSEDEMFILKTVEHSEAEFLLKLLPQYYMNIVQNPRTLLPKFFGLYCYKALGKNVRMLVMDNILPRRIKYHHKFDLKGSSYKRFASDKEKTKTVPTLKDLDFAELYPEGIFLGNETYLQLMSLFKRDTLVLQSFKIMDYSLLLGIHNLDKDIQEAQKLNENLQSAAGDGSPPVQDDQILDKRLGRTRSINRARLAAFQRANINDQSPDEGLLKATVTRQPSTISDGTGVEDEWTKALMQANIDPDLVGGSILGKTPKGERLLIFMGIIDILQYWKLRKKLEHAFKSIFHDGNTISVCHPTFYAKRFQEFMAEKVFRPQIDSLKFKLADIPMRLSSRLHPPLLHMPNQPIAKRNSLSRSTLPNTVPVKTFVKTGSLTRHPNALQPDIVASATGGTDTSSSIGISSHPTSESASPLGHTKLRIRNSFNKPIVIRDAGSAGDIALDTIAIEGVMIRMDGDEDDVRIRSGSALSSGTSVSATRVKLVELVEMSTVPEHFFTDRPKSPRDALQDGTSFAITQVSEGTQTAGAVIAEPDYEETDL
ncbi:phosphatidylinositol 4-phosphate 5-kinase type-1 alpha-like [Paramacrobiotus metropolitanus]|uniref:phosphatidylinositol 4-phosphate 5-kinase type-1 alpha-like n=1 Tax=Paramacrobiotus metropolitanus TaxID=2943436 RepID=UPI0024463EF8|nr:phosphatidylinositol 4-phosphate 5-kinase type-1 alpha-like [Paramacrobiotus metropolitanus]